MLFQKDPSKKLKQTITYRSHPVPTADQTTRPEPTGTSQHLVQKAHGEVPLLEDPNEPEASVGDTRHTVASLPSARKLASLAFLASLPSASGRLTSRAEGSGETEANKVVEKTQELEVVPVAGFG